ncbi:MAG: nucleoside-diphosphate kinase [Acidobacteriota bacterium]
MAERTLTILKPDVMAKRVEGHVLQRLLDEGFEIVGLRLKRLSESEAAGFYAVHRERPFYPELVRFMTSGPVLVACLERDNAVAHLRAVMGPTDSGKAPKDTIRGRFGTDVQANAIHGSDSPENAEKEIRFFFPGGKFD